MLTQGTVESTPLIWFGIGFVVLGLSLGRYVPDIWRAGPAYERMKRQLDDTYGGIQGAAFVASLPLASAMLTVGGVLALIFLVRDVSTGQLLLATDTARSVVTPTFLVLLVLFFSVILFGRPKVIIPPHLRSHGGVIPEFSRWAARRVSAAARDIRRR